VLQRLHDDAPTEHFTLDWLMGSLRKRSFGTIMLLLPLISPACLEQDRRLPSIVPLAAAIVLMAAVAAAPAAPSGA